MPQTIYLIDDDEVTLFMHRLQLSRAFPDSEINSFVSAGEALTALLASKTNLPSLLLMDVNLPIMDAWEFLDALKSRNIALKEGSLFLLSSEFSPADREELSNRNLENRAYPKPLNEALLQEILHIAG